MSFLLVSWQHKCVLARKRGTANIWRGQSHISVVLASWICTSRTPHNVTNFIPMLFIYILKKDTFTPIQPTWLFICSPASITSMSEMFFLVFKQIELNIWCNDWVTCMTAKRVHIENAFIYYNLLTLLYHLCVMITEAFKGRSVGPLLWKLRSWTTAGWGRIEKERNYYNEMNLKNDKGKKICCWKKKSSPGIIQKLHEEKQKLLTECLAF